ncbi:transcriptional regulator [Inhella inkyongensis]|uniref:Transcriptional regulator n=1 Tax=Inhella inkyongensis TaxID=392593 RepID=A0A840S630_9BURK|nr:FMN-binding negative transcriptional regulator [Inhella inkyongensis]MBB5204968.1 transcriptional regulator [Inhella inkyongensis]
MYQPSYHAPPDNAALWALIQAHPLGHWVCHTEQGLQANAIPWVLDRSGERVRLRGHVARANPVVRQLAAAGSPSVVCFVGPQAYITPTWYPGKAAHGKVVPTWNYLTAHVHGPARVVDDAEWLRQTLVLLTAAQEGPTGWRLDDAPPDFIQGLQRAVVGVEIEVDRLEGRFKLSQDEEAADRLGTLGGLRARGRGDDRLLADWIESFPARAGERTA